jgi:type IV secretion system protein VirB1
MRTWPALLEMIVGLLAGGVLLAPHGSPKAATPPIVAPSGAAIATPAPGTMRWGSAPSWPPATTSLRHQTDVHHDHLDAASVQALAERCAPTVPSSVLVSIARVESGYSPWIIRINGSARRILRPRSEAEAVRLASSLIDAGRNVDLGLAQINSANFARLGASPAEIFDPCRNLAVAADILNRGYARSLAHAGTNRSLLQTTYSIYNTGNIERGLENGYAAKVEAGTRRSAR